MGHTHYNELANDGTVLCAATSSTGQIEEGPPGFFVTNLDDGVVSWKFKPLGEWPLVTLPKNGSSWIHPTPPNSFEAKLKFTPASGGRELKRSPYRSIMASLE